MIRSARYSHYYVCSCPADTRSRTLLSRARRIQAALDEPRFTKHSFGGCGVQFESRIPESVRKQLAAMGHDVKVQQPFAGPMSKG